MKRAILIFAVVTAVTGVASAQILRPSAAPNVPPGAKAETPPPAKPEAVKREVAKQDSTPARITPTLVARQAPVPMHLAPRVPIAVKETPPQEANGTETALPETIRGISDANARAAIEADGYKRVRVISKSEDGTWRARAFRGSTEVALRVDPQGNVMAE
jgi:hypothetical protein